MSICRVGWSLRCVPISVRCLTNPCTKKPPCLGLIEEIYTFLRQADARELRHLFVDLDEARKNGGDVDAALAAIDNHETHVVPIIADIDAGFGNEEATYLLAKKMIEAGACCIQIENQVSDAKQWTRR